MRFAYHATMCNPAFYLDLAKAAEAVGFDTFTLPDSICYPKDAESKYPYNIDGSREFLDGVPFIEPFSLVPWMGAVTTRLKFSTSVMKLPIRNPVLVAKSLASVAVLTNNRFDFGVGLSPWKEDFEACGEDWSSRGKRMDQMIEIIRGLLTGDYYGYESEYYKIPPIKLCPVPTAPVPILLGGHTEPALRRAARLCDGWISANCSTNELAEMMGKIEQYRQEYGRAGTPFTFQGMGADGYSPDGIRRLEDLGIDEVLVAFRDAYAGGEDKRTLSRMIDEINHYADTVIAKTR